MFHIQRAVHNESSTMYVTQSTFHCVRCIIYIPLCALHNVHSTMYVTQCTFHYVRYTMFVPLCTLHNLHSTMFVPQCSFYNVRSTVYVPRCTFHNLRSTMYVPQFTFHDVRSTVYVPRCTFHNLQRSCRWPRLVALAKFGALFYQSLSQSITSPTLAKWRWRHFWSFILPKFKSKHYFPYTSKVALDTFLELYFTKV